MTNKFVPMLFLAGLIAVASALPDRSVAQDAERTQQDQAAQEGIKGAIDQYFKGHATGDPAEMRKAFLPTAHIEGIRDGKFTSWTVDEYCAFGKGKPADDESSRVRTIDSIDVSGNAGIVKATLVYGAVTFTDYFVLLRVDGEWKIANKVYYRHGSDGEKR